MACVNHGAVLDTLTEGVDIHWDCLINEGGHAAARSQVTQDITLQHALPFSAISTFSCMGILRQNNASEIFSMQSYSRSRSSQEERLPGGVLGDGASSGLAVGGHGRDEPEDRDEAVDLSRTDAPRHGTG